MDCFEVQQLLSEAVDGEQVRRERLAEARAHCTECAECSSFVRGLALVHRTPPPAEPAGLADRVVAAIREEAARAAEAAGGATAAVDEPTAAGAADATGTSPSAAPGIQTAAEAGSQTGPVTLGARRPRRRMSPLTIGAAAAVLIIASFAAVSGVRSIVRGPTDASLLGTSAENGVATTPSTADQAAEAPPGSEATKESGGAASAPVTAVSPNMIAANGYAYRLIASAPVDRSKLTTFTTTTTSLDSASAPQSYTVFGTSTGGRVALVHDDETLFFDLVRRNYEGRAYALTSGPLSSFEIWPSLPTSIPKPTTPKGAPTFISAGVDDTGIEVYRLPTGSASQGISVPPGTQPSDPAAGNPNWTWWTPVLN